MQINLIKLEQTVATAKAKAADSPAWLRAIEKAAETLRSNPHIEIRDKGDVLFLSTSSNQIYQINGKCAAENGQPCKGYTYNNGVCYHRALKKLIVRYNESEAAPPAASDERATLIDAIMTTWSRHYSDAQIAAGLMRRFGTNTLKALSTPILRKIREALV